MGLNDGSGVKEDVSVPSFQDDKNVIQEDTGCHSPPQLLPPVTSTIKIDQDDATSWPGTTNRKNEDLEAPTMDQDAAASLPDVDRKVGNLEESSGWASSSQNENENERKTPWRRSVAEFCDVWFCCCCCCCGVGGDDDDECCVDCYLCCCKDKNEDDDDDDDDSQLGLRIFLRVFTILMILFLPITLLVFLFNGCREMWSKRRQWNLPQ